MAARFGCRSQPTRSICDWFSRHASGPPGGNRRRRNPPSRGRCVAPASWFQASACRRSWRSSQIYRLSGTGRWSSLRRALSEAHLHVNRGAPESHRSDADAPLGASHQCLQQEVGEPVGLHTACTSPIATSAGFTRLCASLPRWKRG